MTSVNRVQTVSHSTVSGGAEWDHRLNRLLEDLQDTVVPGDPTGGATEYREYRVHSSTKRNDEPAQTMDERWVEYGSSKPGEKNYPALSDSAYSSSKERTVNFADDHFSRSFTSDRNLSDQIFKSSSNNVEYMTPANTTTIVKSGPSSPNDPYAPKVEKKEFYSKASYTSVVKGGTGDIPPPTFDSRDTYGSNRTTTIERQMLPPLPEPAYGTSSSTETRRVFSQEKSRTTGYSGEPSAPPAIGPPLYSSTPMKSTTTSYNREVISDRNVTPPPPVQEGLKTPPLVRKILQQSNKTDFHSKSSYQDTKTVAPRPPVIPSYDEPPERSTRYYTSTTKTEHRENRELSPVRRFPSPHPPRHETAPPKRLDELLATFGESYTETRRITGDGGGPHQSHPYGPGTQPVEHLPVHQQQQRSVRIDESSTRRHIIDETDVHQRRNATNYQNPAYGGPEPLKSSSVAPTFAPPPEEVPRGKGKEKAKKEQKAKEKMKSKHGEDKGQGMCPVPVCVPVCCAAPCTIM